MSTTELGLTVIQALQQRRSIRGFEPREVPAELIEEIFTKASMAPSNCNTQPWHVNVVSGEARKKLEEQLMAGIMQGAQPQFHFKPGDMGLSGVYKERQFDCAARYYGTMGIERSDRDKRNWLMAKNWQFFGAPHAAFISMPKTMGEVNAIDIGIYLQTLMLLLVEHGLASCPQGALAAFPEPVKAITLIPEGNELIVGLSFGYEAVGEQINKVTMERAPLGDTVTFTR